MMTKSIYEAHQVPMPPAPSPLPAPIIHAASLQVCAHAHDVDDARQLLNILGLPTTDEVAS